MNRYIETAKKLGFPIFLLLAGVAILIESNRIVLTAAIEKGNIINARFYPRVVGFVVLTIAIIEIFIAVKHVITETAEAETPETEKDVQKNALNNRRLIIFITMIIIYQVLFFVIGFVLSTLVFLVAVFRFLGCRSKVKLIVTSVVMTGTIYLLFSVVLNVPLPRGIFM